MTGFLIAWVWPFTTALALIAALINFGVAISRRNFPMVALVRSIAGLVCLGLATFIIAGKNLGFHPPVSLKLEEVFIGAGVFVFLVLWLPSQFERNSEAPQRPTLQERAARPARATVRLQQTIPEDWIN